MSVWITLTGVSGGSNDVGAISRMYDTADLYPVEGGLPVLLIFFGLHWKACYSGCILGKYYFHCGHLPKGRSVAVPHISFLSEPLI